MVHKLHLSDQEFRQLALGLYLGNWLANAQSVPGEEPHPEIDTILQKVYKVAKDKHVAGLKIAQRAGIYSCAQHDSLDSRDVYSIIIQEYDRNTVFEGLAHALAQRDAHEALDHGGESGAQPKHADNRMDLELAAYNDYVEEFAEQGLGRVVVNPERQAPCQEVEK